MELDEEGSTMQLMLSGPSVLLNSGNNSSGNPRRVVVEPKSAVANLPGVLEVHSLLGVGTFSYVYSCTMEGLKDRAAVKLLAGPPEPMDQNREANILTQLNHPNLVRLLRVVQGPPHALALELCLGGSLQELLHGSSGGKERLAGVTVQARARAALDVLFAVEYLHDQGVVHRDVKSGNSFLSRRAAPEPSELPPLKLGDLGFARNVANAAMMTRGVGTVRYMAPEVITSGSYGFPADVYSFGVLLHEILSGEMPYGAQRLNNGALAVAILEGQRPSFAVLPPESGEGTGLRKLLEDCFSGEPSRRASAAELVERLAVEVGSIGGRH